MNADAIQIFVNIFLSFSRQWCRLILYKYFDVPKMDKSLFSVFFFVFFCFFFLCAICQFLPVTFYVFCIVDYRIHCTTHRINPYFITQLFGQAKNHLLKNAILSFNCKMSVWYTRRLDDGFSFQWKRCFDGTLNPKTDLVLFGFDLFSIVCRWWKTLFLSDDIQVINLIQNDNVKFSIIFN